MTAMEWTFALSGLGLGAIISFLLVKGQQGNALADKQRQIESLNNQLTAKNEELSLAREIATQAQTRLETTLEQHAEWKKSLESQWKQQLESFMLSNLKNVKENASEEYQAKQKLIEEKVTGLLKPLSEAVLEYKKTVEKVDKEQHANKEVIGEELKRLIQSTTRLSSALTFNKGRGDWGELELRRLLEDSGMQEGVSFQCQVALDNKSRPDFRILMPGERVLFVDSKALQFDPQWFEEEDTSPDAVEMRQRKFVTSLRQAVKGLADREYQNELKESAGFVVLYVPREAMLSNALMLEPGLFEESYAKKVILAGPLNLMAILKAIEHSWSMAQQSQRALKVLDEAQKLYVKSLTFVERFDAIGKGIQSTVKAYQLTLTAFEGQGGMISRLQNLEKLGIKHKDKLLEEVTHIDFEHQPLKNAAMADAVALETVDALENALNAPDPLTH
jgi:DNA recombination protein RmuC